MFSAPNDIRASLIEAGIDEAAAGLLVQQAKPAVWLKTREVKDEAEIPVGATRFGGRPDLPAGVAWPVRPPWPNAEEEVALFPCRVALWMKIDGRLIEITSFKASAHPARP